MRNPFTAIERFFFRSESALGLGLMRSAWGACVLLSMGLRAGDIHHYYSDIGYWTPEITRQMTRGTERFTILDYVHDPQFVTLLFALLIASAFTTMIGLLPRLSAIVTFLLLASFHERNFLPLAGGDTVVRLMGFLVMISPGISAFSIQRLIRQWDQWKINRTLLPAPRVPAWPRLLITAQLIILYVSSAWFKAYGDNWWSGSASAFALHNPLFARFNPKIFDNIPYSYSFITYFTLAFEWVWLLFLIPPFIAVLFNRYIPGCQSGRLRRWMLFIGVLFHLCIMITLSVGSFSYAMFSFYLGMLKEEDFLAMRRLFNRFSRGPVTMLYDGHCRLCTRIAFVIKNFDHLDRVRFANIRDPKDKKALAPKVSMKELDRVVHLRMPKGTLRKSYSAMRTILSRLPIAWILIPILWFPGAKLIGTPVYDFVASRRPRCTDESCRI